jgi:1-acyl-sn-glycerol-3-phosphate acyltransferase
MSQLSHQPLDGLSLDQRDPKFIESSLMPIWDWFYHHYFQVTTEGWHHVPPAGKVMIVGSHNGGLVSPDMYMMIYDWFRHFGTERPAYALTHPNLWQLAPFLAEPAAKCGSLQATAEMAISALQQEAALLVYPGGLQDVFRPYSQRNKIRFEGNTEFIKLALRKEVPIVPLVSKGALLENKDQDQNERPYIGISDFLRQVFPLNLLGRRTGFFQALFSMPLMTVA